MFHKSKSIAFKVTVFVVFASFVASAAKAQGIVESMMKAAGVPQMEAFLPDKYDVEKTEELPIDGVWRISTIKKKIKIEKGRAYAIDSWMHMFTLKVQPNMVVLKNFERVSPGVYKADDLPLLGPATMRMQEDGNLSVKIEGKLSPVKYTLIKLEVDDESAFDRELAIVNGGSDYSESDSEAEEDPNDDSDSNLADCVNLGVDPETAEVVCMD